MKLQNSHFHKFIWHKAPYFWFKFVLIFVYAFINFYLSMYYLISDLHIYYSNYWTIIYPKKIKKINIYKKISLQRTKMISNFIYREMIIVFIYNKEIGFNFYLKKLILILFKKFWFSFIYSHVFLKTEIWFHEKL